MPGNHDAPLIRAWVRAQGAGAGVDAAVPPTPPARWRWSSRGWRRRGCACTTRACGWPSGVFATHGHYLDHHLLPESAFGVLRWERLLGRLREGARRSTTSGAAARRAGQRVVWSGCSSGRRDAARGDVAELIRATAMPGVPARCCSTSAWHR